MTKSKEPDQGRLWDDPDITPTFYIDSDQAREDRKVALAKFVEGLAAPLISGHNLHFEVMSATINEGEIHLSYRLHGVVQRPGLIAVPGSRAIQNLKLPARITPIDNPGQTATQEEGTDV